MHPAFVGRHEQAAACLSTVRMSTWWQPWIFFGAQVYVQPTIFWPGMPFSSCKSQGHRTRIGFLTGSCPTHAPERAPNSFQKKYVGVVTKRRNNLGWEKFDQEGSKEHGSGDGNIGWPFGTQRWPFAAYRSLHRSCEFPCSSSCGCMSGMTGDESCRCFSKKAPREKRKQRREVECRLTGTKGLQRTNFFRRARKCIGTWPPLECKESKARLCCNQPCRNPHTALEDRVVGLFRLFG